MQDTADPPAATLLAQGLRFQRFRTSYNDERPHAALDNATPGERYTVSPRSWDGVLRPPEPEVGEATRRVKSNGLIRWGGLLVYVSDALDGEAVCLSETDEGAWTVRYGPLVLGLIEPGRDRLKRPAQPTPAHRAPPKTPDGT